MRGHGKVAIRSKAEIEMARRAGGLAAEVLRMIGDYVRPGITTDELDRICHAYIVDELKATPANVGYLGYPKTVLTSINHVVCHGVPSDKRLKEGDIVNIDVAVEKDGWFGDTSRMYFVGEPGILARRLVRTTTMQSAPAFSPCAPARPWATSAMLSRPLHNARDSASYANSAAMA